MDSQKRCASCALEIPVEARKCPHCRARQPGAASFERPAEGKLIAGVCAGIARELGLDPALVRLAFALGALVSLGVVFWGYVILWVITPLGRYEDPPLGRWTEWLRRTFSPSPASTTIREEPRG